MKRIIFLASLIASLFILNSLVRSISSLWSKQELLVKAQKQLENKKRENEQLGKRLSQVQSQEFIEKEVRNRLFLVKPGESLVLIPEELLKASESAKGKAKDQKPNWQKWWELFFP